MTRKRKCTLAAIVTSVIVLAAVVLKPTPVSVEAATVSRDTLQTSVVADGQTRVRNRYTIAAPVAGRLQRISLREGDVVEEGSVVARLSPTPEGARAVAGSRAQLDAAQSARDASAARVEQLTAAAKQAAMEAARRKTLSEAGAVSREDMEKSMLVASDAERQVEAAQAQLRAASADVEAARSALIGAGGRSADGGVLVIRAPVGGRVLKVSEPSERVVAPGTPLVELGNLGGLEVVVDVLSQDAARISSGAMMSLSDWGGDSAITARVRQVEPDAFTKVSALGVQEQRVNVVGDIDSVPPRLGAGFRVVASIVAWTGADVLVVPTSALFQDASGWAVFKIVDGKAQRAPVTIGHRNDRRAEVTGGLSVGERVVLFPSDQIRHGVRVTEPRD